MIGKSKGTHVRRSKEKATSANTFPKLVISEVLAHYGVRLTSEELKVAVEERIGEIEPERWKEIIRELSERTGMIMQ